MNNNDKPELLPNQIIERAKKLNTTLISDAMDGSGSMDYNIKPAAPNAMVIGTAITVDVRAGDNLFLHQAIYTSEVGYILIVDGKGNTSNAYIGELMAGAAKAIGIEGIVIDGLMRDKQALTNMNYPLFSKGFIPNGPFKNGPGKLNSTISCGGVTVEPGDLVIGDDDGVVVVPQGEIEVIFTKAEKKLAYENKRVAAIKEYEKERKQGKITTTLEPDWLKDKMSLYRF